MDLLYIAPLAGLVALAFAGYLMTSVLRESPGNQKMQEISQAIFEGAMAFLNRQYKTLVPFTVVIFFILFYVDGYKLAVSFLVGAVCSAIAGYVGMTSTTKSNARTTEAARHSLNKALSVSFRAGAVMGMSVAGLGLLGVSGLYIVFRDPVVINSFAFGASAIAFFARVGGGIFTKAADVGADLVGKVEAGIPEDDPRNPAVIADNVGDNVGDTAGMGADLFESYAATAIAAMLIGQTVFKGDINGVPFPLVIGAAGIFASIISTFLVRTSEDGNPQDALNRGIWGTNILVAISTYVIASMLFPAKAFGITVAVICGLAVNVLVGMITEYYTSNDKSPTQHIADSI
ncbi:MAG: sodium/proton-translocating pyrophosphatase [Sporomusa sp.]